MVWQRECSSQLILSPSLAVFRTASGMSPWVGSRLAKLGFRANQKEICPGIVTHVLEAGVTCESEGE